MKITRYMFVITSILVIGLVMNAGCKKGVDGDAADLGDEVPGVSSGGADAGEGVDFAVTGVKLVLPNDEELELDSKRISRHSKIKVTYEGELPSDIGLKLGGNAVEYTVLSDTDGELLLKPNMPLHNLKTYELGDSSFTVKAPGDVNGDGLSDFVVGIPDYDDGNHCGAAFVYFGKADLDFPLWYDDAAGLKILNYTASDIQLGAAVTLGDVNGDGIDDVAIGAPAEGKGCVYIFHGASGIQGDLIADGSQDTRVCRDSGSSNGEFGGAVAFGDLNGDGFEDLIIGEPLSDGTHNSLPNIADAGVVKVMFGSVGGILDKSINALNQADNSYHSITKFQKAGYSVAAADINGDGYDDVIIGAIGTDVPPAANCKRGKVFIINGEADLLNTGKILVLEAKADQTVEGEGCFNNRSDLFGFSLAAMTSESKDDVLIGTKSSLYKYVYDLPKELIMGGQSQS